MYYACLGQGFSHRKRSPRPAAGGARKTASGQGKLYSPGDSHCVPVAVGSLTVATVQALIQFQGKGTAGSSEATDRLEVKHRRV